MTSVVSGASGSFVPGVVILPVFSGDPRRILCFLKLPPRPPLRSVSFPSSSGIPSSPSLKLGPLLECPVTRPWARVEAPHQEQEALGPPGRVLPLLLSELRGGGPTVSSAAWHRALAFSGDASARPLGLLLSPSCREAPGLGGAGGGDPPLPRDTFPPAPPAAGAPGLRFLSFRAQCENRPPPRPPRPPASAPWVRPTVLVGTFPLAGTLSCLALHASGTQIPLCRSDLRRSQRVRVARLSGRWSPKTAASRSPCSPCHRLVGVCRCWESFLFGGATPPGQERGAEGERAAGGSPSFGGLRHGLRVTEGTGEQEGGPVGTAGVGGTGAAPAGPGPC